MEDGGSAAAAAIAVATTTVEDAVKLSHSGALQGNVGLIPASTCSTRAGNGT